MSAAQPLPTNSSNSAGSMRCDLMSAASSGRAARAPACDPLATVCARCTGGPRRSARHVRHEESPPAASWSTSCPPRTSKQKATAVDRRLVPERCLASLRQSGGLLQVLAHELGHREHVDGSLAAKNRLQVIVGVDHPSVLLVLQPVLLDVGPQLLGDLGPRYRLCTNDLRQRLTGGHRLHESRVRFPGTRLLFCHSISSGRCSKRRESVPRNRPFCAARHRQRRWGQRYRLKLKIASCSSRNPDSPPPGRRGPNASPGRRQPNILRGRRRPNAPNAPPGTRRMETRGG